MSDTMLFGVLRMPYELAMSTELSRRQFHDRAQQACDALEAMQAEPTIDEAYVAELKRVWRDMPSAAPAPVADDELPEPYAWAVNFPDEQRIELVHDLDDLVDDLTNCVHDEPEPLYTADDVRAAIAREREKSDALKSVMVAAAEEISAHWDAHCDAEGYGPQNLMRRLEEGIPSEYSYTAGRFAELQVELSTLHQQLAALNKAAQAVIDRWDTPLWKDAKHTGEYINALRTAIAAGVAKP